MSTTWSAVIEMETTDVSRPRQVRLVLFDLDGTFADTAPDLAFALNRTLVANDRPQLPLETIRLQVSHGAVALIMLGFGIGPDHPRFDTYREQLLGVYQRHLARETTLFPGMEALLEQLERRNIAWGIVTNKPGWLTEPLMQQLGFSDRAAAIVSALSRATVLVSRAWTDHPRVAAQTAFLPSPSPGRSTEPGSSRPNCSRKNTFGCSP